MSEYIERGALLEHIEEELAFCKKPCPENNLIAYGCELGLKGALSFIKTAPAADVEEVKHGEWDDTGRYKFPGGSVAVRCSECGCCLTAGEYRMNVWNYCPVCGARMDGGADNG